jgi:endonuclease G
MKTRHIIIVLLSLLAGAINAQPSLWCQPKSECGDQILLHTGFSLKYNSRHKIADWVAYDLIPEKRKTVARRTDNFRPDPSISRSESAQQKDYAGSGYDRGHLAPAADMAWSAEAMSESFYFSNMAPQAPAFNRGIWKKLEDKVRKWAKTYDTLLVVAGPILHDSLPYIGANRVSIPQQFFKAIVIYTEKKKSGIAFIIPNQGSGNPIMNFSMTIDSLEALIGYDLFGCLPAEQQMKFEESVIPFDWH